MSRILKIVGNRIAEIKKQLVISQSGKDWEACLTLRAIELELSKLLIELQKEAGE